MKYRIYAFVGLLAMSAGAILQAQDYDDIYYDASKSTTKTKTKVVQPTKTVAVYGEVPERYKEAVQSNYSTDRDVDEYNRRGAYDPSNAPAFEVDINGDTIYFDNDTIYEEAFANTRRIERFYNPDIVILSDDDDLVELYYSESPTINLIVGSDWGYSSYYPWYTGWYEPWYMDYGWYSPWRWHSPWYYGYRHWGWTWGYNPWYYGSWSWGWGHNYWAWNHRPYWGWSDWNYAPSRPHHNSYVDTGGRPGIGSRAGLATNRNGRGRVDATGSNRNSIGARGAASSSRGSSVGTGSRSRGGYASSRGGGNMGSRNSSGVTSRSGGINRSPSSSTSGRSYSGSSGSSSRSSSGSYSSGSRSSGGSSGSYSGGGGSRGSSGGGGGGSHGGSSGGSRRH